MPILDTLLSFPTNSAGPSTAAEGTPIPPRSSQILVTDTIDSPALFVLTHFLKASHAINRLQRATAPPVAAGSKGKGRAHTKVIWLGCNSDGIAHLKSVARKSGVHLDEESRDGAFCYIDANSDVLSSSTQRGIAGSMALMRIQDEPPRAEQSLRRLYGKVAEELSNVAANGTDEGGSSADWASRNIIVVDDLTALAWALDPCDIFGHPVDVAQQLSHWLSSLNCLAAQNEACVITLMHADATSCSKDGASDRVDESLLHSLLQAADVWVEVKQLASGRARDCDGEITVHPLVRPSLARALPPSSGASQDRQPHSKVIPSLRAFAIETPCPSRSKAVLYRIAPDGQSAAFGGASVGSNTGRVQVWARGTGRGFL